MAHETARGGSPRLICPAGAGPAARAAALVRAEPRRRREVDSAAMSGESDEPHMEAVGSYLLELQDRLCAVLGAALGASPRSL